MASANFKAYDRTLRRIYMMNLVDTLEYERRGGFRASLVVNPRTGLPELPTLGEFARTKEQLDVQAAAVAA